MNKLIGFCACVVAVFVIVMITYGVCTENVGAGYVGYKYDRTLSLDDDNVIPGTSVIDEQLTGLVWMNPITQDVIKYPTTILSLNWTSIDEGDHKEDMSMQIASQEGKTIIADVYVSVRAKDVGKLIGSFGTKSFDKIVDDDVYGLVKGKLNVVAQNYSVYDVQANRSKIQDDTFSSLSNSLNEIYGIELIRFEIGTLTLPVEIQNEINQKTSAINAVELAKLDRERQNEVNQQTLDSQRASSEKDLIKRQTEADAAAYEKQKQAEAAVVVAESNVRIAEYNLEVARLDKEAEIEKQGAFTDSYFRDKELDVKMAAVQAINSKVQTIITNGDDGYGGLVGIKEILEGIG